MIKAKKHFGQNFLINDGYIYNLFNYISPKSNQDWLEIGAGTGALTKLLLPLVKKLYAIEIDKDLFDILQKKLSANNFLLYNENILKFNFKQIKESKIRVIGNLPYNISTAILFYLFKHNNIITDMSFMLQKEVVDRITASVNTKSYGKLSVMTQYFCEVVALEQVPPEAFSPQPKVFSKFVYLKPHKNIIAKDEKLFAEVVSLAFNLRRKKISNSLKNKISSDDLTKIKIDPNLRAENLTVIDYVNISNFLCQLKPTI